jgi:Na+/melibiose symporter-like transporter
METTGKLILRLAGTVVGIAAVIAIVVLLLGVFLQWKDPVKFSDGFFMAGALLIVSGVLSVAGGFTQRANVRLTYTESAAQASMAERNQRTVTDGLQRYQAMITLLGAGLLLILASVFIGQFLL